MRIPALLTLTAALLTACASPERAAREQAATVAWLSPDGSRPRIDVTGSWSVPGWGTGYLAQTGPRITGYIDEYPLSGIVRNDSINLAISQDGVTRYTGTVVPNSSTRLEGFYSASIPFNPETATPHHLRQNQSLTTAGSATFFRVLSNCVNHSPNASAVANEFITGIPPNFRMRSASASSNVRTSTFVSAAA